MHSSLIFGAELNIIFKIMPSRLRFAVRVRTFAQKILFLFHNEWVVCPFHFSPIETHKYFWLSQHSIHIQLHNTRTYLWNSNWEKKVASSNMVFFPYRKPFPPPREGNVNSNSECLQHLTFIFVMLVMIPDPVLGSIPHWNASEMEFGYVKR